MDEVLLFECDLRTGRRYGPAKEVVRLDKRSLSFRPLSPFRYWEKTATASAARRRRATAWWSLSDHLSP